MNTSDIKCIAICMTVVGSLIYVHLYLFSVMVAQLFPVYHSVLCTNVVSGTLIALQPSLKWTFTLRGQHNSVHHLFHTNLMGPLTVIVQCHYNCFVLVWVFFTKLTIFYDSSKLLLIGRSIKSVWDPDVQLLSKNEIGKHVG